MFRFKCPHCGTRDMVEFTYGGDASVDVPDLGANRDAWFDAVYQRTNPRGPHVEYWHHVAGCRQWIRVERDTLTHEVLATGAATGPLRRMEDGEAFCGTTGPAGRRGGK